MDEINNLDSGNKRARYRVRPTQNVHEVKYDGQNLSTKPDDNYQNTPMGKAVQKKYADILHGSRPEPSYRHPRMTPFQPGQDLLPICSTAWIREEIAAEGEEHLKVTKIELSEEDKGKLSDKLLQVKKGMEVTVCSSKLMMLNQPYSTHPLNGQVSHSSRELPDGHRHC